MSVHPFIPLVDAARKVVEGLSDKDLIKSESLRGLVIALDVEDVKEKERKDHSKTQEIKLVEIKLAGEKVEVRSLAFGTTAEKVIILPGQVMEIYREGAWVIVSTRER